VTGAGVPWRSKRERSSAGVRDPLKPLVGHRQQRVSCVGVGGAAGEAGGRQATLAARGAPRVGAQAVHGHVGLARTHAREDRHGGAGAAVEHDRALLGGAAERLTPFLLALTRRRKDGHRERHAHRRVAVDRLLERVAQLTARAGLGPPRSSCTAASKSSSSSRSRSLNGRSASWPTLERSTSIPSHLRSTASRLFTSADDGSTPPGDPGTVATSGRSFVAEPSISCITRRPKRLKQSLRVFVRRLRVPGGSG
jgi:hypothetical protein